MGDFKLSETDKKRITLDPSLKSNFIEHLEKILKKQVIGQDEAVDHILGSLDRVASGVKNKEKPVLTMLFLGPTGTGKTECVKVLAETIFGSRDAFIRVNCQEFTSDHMIARLFGSPPGYVGNEIEPMLSQDNIDKFCKNAIQNKQGIFDGKSKWGDKLFNHVTEDYLSIILFDEIEKAHPKIWTALLGLMDDGNLLLGKNERVNFKNCIIVMTTNVGSREIDKTLKGSLGFQIEDEDKKQVDIKKKAFEEVKDVFPPEFCNRFDEVVAFKMLSQKDIEQIIGVQLKYFFNTLVESKIPLYIRYTDAVVQHIAKEGFNQQYGARHLNRVLKNKLYSPISKLITTNQLISGDVLTIDYENSTITFTREPRTEEQLKKLESISNNNDNNDVNKHKKTLKKKQIKK
jgi:ATP-dependent Clp protease ATP-binding subunit ClpC